MNNANPTHNCYCLCWIYVVGDVEAIYDLYTGLVTVQSRIRPIASLRLFNYDEGCGMEAIMAYADACYAVDVLTQSYRH